MPRAHASVLTVIALLALALRGPATAFAQRSTPAQVSHPSPSTSDFAGISVAIDGDTMVVGAANDNIGANTDQGSALVYRWTGTDWALEATLTAVGGALSDQFGSSVDIRGDTIVVGAIFDDVGANANQGSAYVFVRAPGGTTWTQQAQLISTDGSSSDFFGYSVAIDGDTVVVGAYGDDIGANSSQGSAYVFTRSGSAWTQRAKLTASDGAADDLFGVGIAISGDTILVGSPANDVGANLNQGSVYVFTRSGLSWVQQAQLVSADGAAGDQFGYSVGLVGDTAVAGAYLDDVGANTDQGSAYIFSRSDNAWTQQAQLTAADGAAGDRLGYDLALSGDTLLVGAYLDDIGSFANQGSAYVFTRAGSAWIQQARLNAPDGLSNDFLGSSVAISGDTAVIGSPNDDLGALTDAGSAWVFSRIGTKWIGPDLSFIAADGAAGDSLGYSVDISGDTAVVGAPFDDNGANVEQGSAYVFVRAGSSWTQQAKLLASDGVASDQFGFDVAISGDTVLVGANLDDVGANTNQGSAYVFTRAGTTWTQQAKLTASDGGSFDQFGTSVAIAGETALIGAWLDDVGANVDQGSAYVFIRSGTSWFQQAKLLASDGAVNDFFGNSVAIDGNTALVGAPGDDVAANTDQGSTYTFVRAGTLWSQQAKLTALDGAPGDLFGSAVALSGDTVLIGTPNDDAAATLDEGSAYVFGRTTTTWTQQAKLTASDGAANDFFGFSVDLASDVAIIGAYSDTVGVNSAQGSAYVFTRNGTEWRQQTKLIAPDGLASDFFGLSVALSGDSAVVGAYGRDVGPNNNQGTVWTYDVSANDFATAYNDVTNVSYSTLAAALLPATTGQQITATEAAWRTVVGVDTAGRSLILRSSGDLRTPPTSTLTLGGSSSLNTDIGNVVEINGQLRVSPTGGADITSDAFTLGSRGILTARTNSSLTINAPLAELDGQTRVEQGAALTLAGNASAIGPTTMAFGSTLTAGGVFENIDTLSITDTTLSLPLLSNRSAFNVFGGCAIFGSFSNNAGAVTTIRGETLFVFGSLTNNGTIIGAICSTCRNGAPDLDVTGTLTLGQNSSLLLPFTNSVVSVGGSFDCAIDSSTRFDLSLATLRLEGSGTEQTLEVMSSDIGADVAGLDRTLAGHYPIGTLHIGPTPSTVRLVDTHDNDGLGQSSCEAIYVDTLRIEAGSRLINTTCRIYYSTLINNGTVDVPGNLVPLTPPVSCDYDYNQDENVDLLDAQQMAQVFVGLLAPEATWLDGDLNGDENADLTDAQLLAAFVVSGNCGV